MTLEQKFREMNKTVLQMDSTGNYSFKKMDLPDTKEYVSFNRIETDEIKKLRLEIVDNFNDSICTILNSPEFWKDKGFEFFNVTMLGDNGRYLIHLCYKDLINIYIYPEKEMIFILLEDEIIYQRLLFISELTSTISYMYDSKFCDIDNIFELMQNTCYKHILDSHILIDHYGK